MICLGPRLERLARIGWAKTIASSAIRGGPEARLLNISPLRRAAGSKLWVPKWEGQSASGAELNSRHRFSAAPTGLHRCLPYTHGSGLHPSNAKPRVAGDSGLPRGLTFSSRAYGPQISSCRVDSISHRDFPQSVERRLWPMQDRTYPHKLITNLPRARRRRLCFRRGPALQVPGAKHLRDHWDRHSTRKQQSVHCLRHESRARRHQDLRLRCESGGRRPDRSSGGIRIRRIIPFRDPEPGKSRHRRTLQILPVLEGFRRECRSECLRENHLQFELHTLGRALALVWRGQDRFGAGHPCRCEAVLRRVC